MKMNIMMMMLMRFPMYSTNTSGLEQMPETNNLTPNFTRLRQTRWLLTSVAENLNS